MKSAPSVCLLLVLGNVSALAAENSPATRSRRGVPRDPAARAVPIKAEAVPAPALPALPEDVRELKFADFFKLPVGPQGLELADRARELDGKRVRILGFMVREDLSSCGDCTAAPPASKAGRRAVPHWLQHTVPGRMMLTPRPVMVSYGHYALSDDLPPQTLFVTVPDKFGELVPYTPGPMLLTGVLSVGQQPEADGRGSVLRLALDPPDSGAKSRAPRRSLSVKTNTNK